MDLAGERDVACGRFGKLDGGLTAPQANVAQGLFLWRQAGGGNPFRIDVQPLNAPLWIAWNEEAGEVIIGNPTIAGNHVRVFTAMTLGDGNNPGLVDANGQPLIGQPLNIGTQDTTNAINIGAGPLVPGQTVNLNPLGGVNLNQQTNFNAQARMNGNVFALDAAGNLKIVANAAGHGWGASADFMVGNDVVGWWDAQGIHVQPPAPPAP